MDLTKTTKQLHKKENHPICILKNKIYSQFKLASKFDDFAPAVSVIDNFDRLFIPKDHPSRSKSNAFYISQTEVLRTHTTAHLCDLLSNSHTSFLLTGDVYRKDVIDKTHYPIFHQMECVRLCYNPLLFLPLTVENLIRDLLPHCDYRKSESVYPFTDPSWKYEIRVKDVWVEILGCGIIRKEIIENCGLNGETGFAFGLGLDRLAMILFDIPDIRLFWSENKKFLDQFKEGKITKFTPFSDYPSCYKDISFWLTDDFNYNEFCDLARDIGGDLIEEITEIDTYMKKGRVSKCYRIKYCSYDHPLGAEAIEIIQNEIKNKFKCELR